MVESTGVNKRVLIVDDEPHIGKIFGMKLKLAGYDVISTTSGKEGIELVQAQKPDIVLLDIVMPDLTGFDVLTKVRVFSQVPIIVFTARPDIAEVAIQHGADDYIAKPLDPVKLLEKIVQVLGKSKQ